MYGFRTMFVLLSYYCFKYYLSLILESDSAASCSCCRSSPFTIRSMFFSSDVTEFCCVLLLLLEVADEEGVVLEGWECAGWGEPLEGEEG